MDTRFLSSRGVRILQQEYKRCAGMQNQLADGDISSTKWMLSFTSQGRPSPPGRGLPPQNAFHDSRVFPGLALAQAILEATKRPGIFIQQSGINHYGLHGDPADESTPPADDFLAQLTVQWENATKSVEKLGVRRVVLRSAVVLDKKGGLMPLMALPVKMFIGGPLGGGKFAMPWIHIDDWVGAVRYLIDDENARGVYNLISPKPTSSEDFNRTLAQVLHRPYWFPTPAFLLRTLLGEMSVLIIGGRFAQPKRLVESGYKFQFEDAREAFVDLYG
jgi:uncharacterized protein